MKRIFFPLLLLLPVNTVFSQNVREPQHLNPSATVLGFGPSIANGGELSCAIWTETSPNYFVYASISDGRGTSWSAPTRIDSDTTNEAKVTQLDSCAVSGLNIIVCWRDDRVQGTNDDLFLTRSTDGGVTWETDRRIDDGYAAGTQAVRSFAMAVDSPYVYIAMRVDGSTGNDEIWVASSSDDGANFGNAVYVSSLAAGTADAINVDVAADGMSCHVVWADDRDGSGEEVLYQRSDDAGVTWQLADVQLDNSPGGVGDAQTLGLSVAVSGDNVAVTWEEERTSTSNEEIRFNISQDGGANWLSQDLMIGNYDPLTVDVDFSSMAMEGNLVLFAWRDNRSGIDQVYAAVTSDFGTTVTETVINLDDDNSSPIAYAWPGLLAISYAGGSTPQNHRVVTSVDDGQTFSSEVSLSGTLTGDTDQTSLTYNPLYRNIMGLWQQDDPGNNQPYVGGFRPQGLTPTTLTAGNLETFDGFGFPEEEVGLTFAVVASGAIGMATVPDGRIVGLDSDNILAISSQNPALGVLDASGNSTTAPAFVPSNLTGRTLQFVGLSFEQGFGVRTITDVVEMDIL